MLMRLHFQKFVLSRAHHVRLARDSIKGFGVLSQMLKNVKLFVGMNYGRMFAP